MIDILVIRLRVEYFLFGDRHVRALMLPRHSLAALVKHGAAVHSMYCSIIAFIPAANKSKASSPCHCYNVGPQFYIHGGVSMTELYTKFIVRRRTTSHTGAVQIPSLFYSSIGI